VARWHQRAARLLKSTGRAWGSLPTAESASPKASGPTRSNQNHESTQHMKTFDLPKSASLSLKKVTPRKENHGPDLIQAISLRFEWAPMEPGQALDMLAPGLLDMLFWTPPDVATQLELDGLPPVKKHRRVSAVAMPIKIDMEFSGYTLTIDHGIDETSALQLYSCELGKFTVDAKDGGFTTIGFSVASNKEMTPELVGQLCALEGGSVTATLEAPLIPMDQPIDGTKAAFAEDHPDATDMFAAGADGGGHEDLEDRLESALDDGAREQAELEAGMRDSLAAAGVKPKAKGARKAVH
jgi:hypothetical protein